MRRAGEEDFSDIHDDHAVADFTNEREIMFDDEDRFSFLLQFLNEFSDLLRHFGRDAGSRFVEEEELLSARESARDLEEAHLSARKRCRFLFRVVGEVDHGECFVYDVVEIAEEFSLNF